MAKMKQFQIAIEEKSDRKDDDPRVGEPFEIDLPGYDDPDGPYFVDGREIVMQPPRLSKFMMLQVQYETSDDNQFELASAASAFVFSCMGSEDRTYLRRRFNNENDPLHLDTLGNIISAMTEEWSARPTKRSTGSSSSQRKRGTASTEKQPSQEETT